MPTKKKPAKRKRAPKRKAAATGQLDQLRKTIKGLRTQLEREMKARRIEARVKAEAQKARAQLSSQIAALRDQGRRLASDLKSALGDASKRDSARKQALDKIEQLRAEYSKRTAEMRAELSRATSELGRKSEELRKLAGETAQRAVGIIRSQESQPAPAPPSRATGELKLPASRSGEPDEEQ